MSWTRIDRGLLRASEQLLRDLVSGSTEGYIALEDGSLFYSGERPGSDWHRHGFTTKNLTRFVDCRPIKTLIRKQRWLLFGTTRTVHSRPAEDVDYVRFCSAIIVLRLCACLFSEGGFHHREEFVEVMSEGCGADRTVQRWYMRALEKSLVIEQSIRLMIIEKVEPRPIETLFPGGLPPPPHLVKKRLNHRSRVETLWRAYTMLLVTAREFGGPLRVHLAEARRRWPLHETPIGI